jgi:RNA recognition motif-containing protein
MKTMSIKLYVGHLSFKTDSEELKELFEKSETVEAEVVVEDRDTGRSRGFGFVEMSSKEEGEAAIQQFNGNDLNGRNLTVNEARPREDRGGGFAGGREYGRTNRGGSSGERSGAEGSKPRNTDDARRDTRLEGEIDAALKEIEARRLEARAYDEEIARLGEETRRLIDEMMEELNLKAA